MRWSHAVVLAPRALLGVHTVQEAKEGGARVISMAITGNIGIDTI